MTSRTTFASAIFVLGAVPASAGNLPPNLEKALKSFDQAYYQSDVPLLAHLASNGYMVLNSNLFLENKRQFLADFALPGFRIDPYVRREQMNSVWKDAAVTAGVVNLGWTQDGKHQTRLLRYVDIWQKRDGRWQVTFTQVTRAQQ
jgi:hypothetical protein